MTANDPPATPNDVGVVDRVHARFESEVNGNWTNRQPGSEVDGPKLRPLYADYYQLAESPFELTPNPRFVFLSSRQREVLSNLRYAFSMPRGFTLVLGEAGTGKTTLVRTALASANTAGRIVLVTNPTLSRDEFYDYLAREFGLSPLAAHSKSRFLAEFRHDVEARLRAGGLTALVVDEAQSMPHELLEEIRLLGNMETPTTKLLSIVLSGQPELADRLNEASLRQLKQRVALRCELRPLALDETAAYVSGRIRIAGGTPGGIFTRETVVAIHEAARGIPRTINVLCENALISGFAAQVSPIPVDVVQEVCRDFDLEWGSSSPVVRTGSGRSLPASGQARAGEIAASSSPEPLDASVPASIAEPRKRRFRFFS